MKSFCFTVDDNIRFLKEITERGYGSMFDHPYPAMYRRLHREFGLCVQLNLFYQTRSGDFDLSQMSDRYASEWAENAHWLKLSFHSDLENVDPYVQADFDEVFTHCAKVNREILRFASPASLAKTTTIHYCRLTEQGIRAVEENGVCGLLGLFGTEDAPGTSYGLDRESADRIRSGETLKRGAISYGSIDLVLNRFSTEEILSALSTMTSRDAVRVMIHEQYFYSDYRRYQPEFEEKLRATFSFLTEKGYESRFFENLISP